MYLDAIDRNLIDKVPAIRLQSNPVRRIRWLKREEADRLLSILPPHQAALVRFSLATGLREKNVTRLEWSLVDLTRRVAWIHPDQAKAKKPIGVPLNNEAVGVLKQEVGKHDKRVFTWQGKPLDKANTRAWRLGLLLDGSTLRASVSRAFSGVRRECVHASCCGWHTFWHTGE